MTQTIANRTGPVNSMIASTQWATRPADQRFESLTDMLDAMRVWKDSAREIVVDTRTLTINHHMDNDGKGDVFFESKAGLPVEFNHHSFNQTCQLVGAPAGYLRSLPPPLISNALDYGLKFGRAVKDDKSEAKALLVAPQGDRPGLMRAFTGPRYGRIWNADVVAKLIEFNTRAGGKWRVPSAAYGGQITNESTTLYASPKDMFVFLVDGENEIDDGSGNGPMHHGFIVGNSEVGDKLFWLMSFVFNKVCRNRIIWGMSQVEKLGIRHTSGAPDRFENEAMPAIKAYANLEVNGLVAGLKAAQQQTIADQPAKVLEYLQKRGLTQTMARTSLALVEKQGRQIGAVSQDPTNLYNVVQGITAAAREIPYTDERTQIEEIAGKLLDQVFA